MTDFFKEKREKTDSICNSLACNVYVRIMLFFQNEYLNHLQSLTSRCLLLVLMCNILPSISFMTDVSTIPNVFLVVRVLSVVELGLYAAVPLSLPVYKLWKFMKQKKNGMKNEKNIPIESEVSSRAI